MQKLILPVAIAVCVLCGFGCRRESGKPESGQFRGGIEIVHNAGKALHPDRHVLFDEEIRIGPGNDASAAKLYAPRSYAVNEQGLIYISDDKDPGIKVFDPMGRPVRTIGRQGNGPGEFQLITALAFLPNGRLLVLDSDLRRTSLFEADGRFISSHQWAGLSSGYGLLFVTDSFYVREVTTVEAGKEPMTWKSHLRVAGFDFAGKEVLSFGDFAARQSGFVPQRFSFSLPFPVLSVLGGDRVNHRLYHCLNDHYTVQVFSEAGKVIREIDRPYKRHRVSAEDWRDYLDGFKGSAENRAGVEKYARKPDLKPVTPRLVVDDMGCLWVQLYEERSDGAGTTLTAFDVFDEKGKYLYQVWSPVIPGLFKGGKMYRMDTDRETGERFLKRYRIRWAD